MSGKLVGKVLNLKLQRVERDVLVILAEACRNDRGEHVSMRVEEIAHILGCSDRQVQRAFASLKQKGVLIDQHAPRNKPTVWNIDVTKAPQIEPYQPKKRTPKGDSVSREVVTLEGDTPSRDAVMPQGDMNEGKDVKGDTDVRVTSLPLHSAPQGDISSGENADNTRITVKDKEQESARARDPRAYELIKAYLSATPEHVRPGGMLNNDSVYQMAKALIDQDCTPDDAAAQTREKFLAGRTNYPFKWLCEDLPAFSLKRRQPHGDPNDRGSLAYALAHIQ